MGIHVVVFAGSAVLGFALGVLLWLRGRHSGAARAFGVSALAIGIGLTPGLFGAMMSAGAELYAWGRVLHPSTTLWAGLSFLGLALLLCVIGRVTALRRPRSDRSLRVRGPSSTARLG